MPLVRFVGVVVEAVGRQRQDALGGLFEAAVEGIV